MARLLRQRPANQAFAVTGPQVHEHGDAAVVVGVEVQETTFGEVDNSGSFRLTLVAVRTADNWRVASVHLGPLQMPPGRPPA